MPLFASRCDYLQLVHLYTYGEQDALRTQQDTATIYRKRRVRHHGALRNFSYSDCITFNPIPDCMPIARRLPCPQRFSRKLWASILRKHSQRRHHRPRWPRQNHPRWRPAASGQRVPRQSGLAERVIGNKATNKNKKLTQDPTLWHCETDASNKFEYSFFILTHA